MVQSTQKELAEKALQLKQQNTEQPSAQLTKRGFSVEEFCESYGICRSLAYVEIREGRLKARKAGRRTIIGDEDAEDWFSKLPRVKAADTDAALPRDPPSKREITRLATAGPSALDQQINVRGNDRWPP